MGLGARLAGVQFALLSCRCPACGAWDGEALLRIQFSNHGGNNAPKRMGCLVNFGQAQIRNCRPIQGVSAVKKPEAFCIVLKAADLRILTHTRRRSERAQIPGAFVNVY